MKIALKFAQTNSGATTWMNNLITALNQEGIQTSTEIYKLTNNFKPATPHPSPNCDLIQTDITGFRYKTNKPLAVVEYHLITDPLIWKYYSFSQKIFNQILHYWELKTLKQADVIISISRYTQKKLTELLGFDSVVIYPGINTNLFMPLSSQIHNKPFQLLFVGNPSKRKGADLLPIIMQKLGPGYLLRYTSGLNKNPYPGLNQTNTISLGKLNLKQLISEYQRCDALLFPSRLEGFCFAVAEAMACSKPIVCSNCSSLPELVINQKGGFLCKSEDVDDFVDKIQLLANKPALVKKMGIFNHQRIINSFSLPKMALQFIKLYENTIYK